MYSIWYWFISLAASCSRVFGNAQFDLSIPRLRVSQLGVVCHSLPGPGSPRRFHRRLSQNLRSLEKILPASAWVRRKYIDCLCLVIGYDWEIYLCYKFCLLLISSLILSFISAIIVSSAVFLHIFSLDDVGLKKERLETLSHVSAGLAYFATPALSLYKAYKFDDNNCVSVWITSSLMWAASLSFLYGFLVKWVEAISIFAFDLSCCSSVF